jgi:hypothetical protein
LIEGGFEIIEVPLNSPEPFASIEKLARRFDGAAMIGAGTVLRPADVVAVRNAGGRAKTGEASLAFRASNAVGSISDDCRWRGRPEALPGRRKFACGA